MTVSTETPSTLVVERIGDLVACPLCDSQHVRAYATRGAKRYVNCLDCFGKFHVTICVTTHIVGLGKWII